MVERRDDTKSMGRRSTSAAKAAVTGRVGRPRAYHRAGDGLKPAEALLVAAIELFAERNFASVTIKDIASRTGVNTALIYYYFGSKERLFLRAIETAVEGAFARFDTVGDGVDDPVSVINSWLNHHVNQYDQIHKLVKISFDYKGAPNHDPAIDRAIQDFYSRERQLLARCVRSGIAKGLFEPVDFERMARFISIHLDGLMVQSVILPDFDLASAVSELRETVFDLLGFPSSKNN